MENGAGISRIEHLVKEIITAGDIPFCKVESVVDYNVRAGEEELLPVIHIVSYFDDAQGMIAELLKAEFELTEISASQGSTEEGFAAQKQQFVATLKDNRASLAEYKRWAEVKFEIELTTVLAAALSGIVHSLGLSDSSALPKEVKRDLFRIEALLETAEKELAKVRMQCGAKEIAHKQPEKPMAAPMKVEVVAPRKPLSAEAEPPKVAAEVKPEPPKAPELAKEEPKPAPAATVEPEPEVKAPPVVNGSTNSVHRTQTGNVISTAVVTENSIIENSNGHGMLSPTNNDMAEALVPISYAVLREFVRNSRLLKEVDLQIAAHAGARLNDDIDIEGDVERLQFLEVFTVKQLHECILENKCDMIAFAEKWIGKDNGGSFDSGIGLFYLEYVLVAKKADPAFATDYVLRYISDNDYSARYIIPTYNSLKLGEKHGNYSAMRK